MTLRRLVLVAKLVLSCGLVWYVATKFDLRQGLSELRNITGLWLFAIFGLYYLQLLLVALRLKEFLGVMGAKVSVLRALDASLIGYFFSQTFISFVGGDAMRAYRISQEAIPLGVTAKAVVLDRASGFVSQVLLIVLMLPFALPIIQDLRMQLSLLAVVTVALVLGGGFIVMSNLPHRLRRFGLMNALADVSGRVLKRVGTTKGAAAFFGYSLAINVLNIVIFFAIAKGLGVPLGFLQCLMLLPPVFFMSMLPISISGWGIREGATILALGLIDIPAPQALAVSVIFGLGLILVSLPGGAIWLVSRRTRATIRNASDAKNQV